MKGTTSVRLPRRRFITTVSAAVLPCALLAIYLSNPAAASNATPAHSSAASGNLSATDAHANLLAIDPHLVPDSLVIVAVKGFAPGAPVTVRLLGDGPQSSLIHATRTGIARLAYRIPPTLSAGHHILVFTGDPSGTEGPPTTPPGDGASIEATIPNLGLFAFDTSGLSRSTSRHG
jgi:hypothetical protein